jgi:ribA/ribD-fused uncharacterized protein
MILSNSRTPEWSWLSNFHPCDISYDGLVYPSVENFYQSMKFSGELRRDFTSISASQSKSRADTMQVTTPNWMSYRHDVMRIGLRLKFQHSDLRIRLLDTGTEDIYHLSPWDLHWGINREMVGENVLGKMLMEIRDNLFATTNCLFSV